MPCSNHSGSSHLLEEDPVNMTTLRRPTLFWFSGVNPVALDPFLSGPRTRWFLEILISISPMPSCSKSCNTLSIRNHNFEFSWHTRVLGRSRWPRGLTRGSGPFACWNWGLKSRQGHGGLSLVEVSDGPITRPEESYRVRYVTACDQVQEQSEVWLRKRDRTTGTCMKWWRHVIL